MAAKEFTSNNCIQTRLCFSSKWCATCDCDLLIFDNDGAIEPHHYSHSSGSNLDRNQGILAASLYLYLPWAPFSHGGPPRHGSLCMLVCIGVPRGGTALSSARIQLGSEYRGRTMCQSARSIPGSRDHQLAHRCDGPLLARSHGGTYNYRNGRSLP